MENLKDWIGLVVCGLVYVIVLLIEGGCIL